MLDTATEAMVRESFAAQGAMRALQAQIVSISPGEVLLSIDRHDGALQQHGLFHGGIIGALADSAAGYSANSLLMPDHEILTAEYKINFLAPARGQTLFAKGKVVKPGRFLVVVTVDCWTEAGGQKVACALAQMTMFVIKKTALAADAALPSETQPEREKQ
jgi:uncharacterized protein (TIGR00369 family)